MALVARIPSTDKAGVLHRLFELEVVCLVLDGSEGLSPKSAAGCLRCALFCIVCQVLSAAGSGHLAKTVISGLRSPCPCKRCRQQPRGCSHRRRSAKAGAEEEHFATPELDRPPPTSACTVICDKVGDPAPGRPAHLLVICIMGQVQPLSLNADREHMYATAPLEHINVLGCHPETGE